MRRWQDHRSHFNMLSYGIRLTSVVGAANCVAYICMHDWQGEIQASMRT